MSQEEQQREATERFSSILSEHGIKHAVIGGFAVHLLGHSRHTIDIDIEIDMQAVTRDQIMQLLTNSDDRFMVESRKLIFKNPDSDVKVVLETLPLGELGLPRHLRTMRVEPSIIPILHPAVLVLTKMKRCVQYIGSTRPQSIVKYRSDLSDIRFLLNWLVSHNQKIDFVGYHAASLERLYQSAADLVSRWQRMGYEELVGLMDGALESGDRERVMQVQESFECE